MTLQEIAKTLKKSCYLVTSVSNHYDKCHIGYLQVLTFLQECEARESDFTLHLEHVEEDFDGTELESDSYYHVYGTKSDDPDQRYSMSFRPWEEWAGMEISEEAVENYKTSEILAHIIWEMTFYGWTPEKIKEVEDDLMQRAAEVEKWIEEGTIDEHTEDGEVLFKRLERKLIQQKQPDFDPFSEKGVFPY